MTARSRRANMGAALLVLALFLHGCAAAQPNPLFDVLGMQAGPAAYGERILESTETRAPVTYLPEPPSEEEAERIRAYVLTAQMRELGPPVGYKAGLTSRAAQARFGVDHPVLGVLLAGMLVPDGAGLPARFGAVPMVEADLLVRVKDEAINEAVTPAEALAGLDAVAPFIELPDLVYKKGSLIGAPAITAINVGARYGVKGAFIPLSDAPEWLDRLKTFSVRLTDDSGAELGRGTGEDILGDPLNAVLWIRDELHRIGVRLKPGDLLSLGTLTPLTPPVGERTFTARYEGLDPAGPASVSVRFVR